MALCIKLLALEVESTGRKSSLLMLAFLLSLRKIHVPTYPWTVFNPSSGKILLLHWQEIYMGKWKG